MPSEPSYTYKNITDNELQIPDVGSVKPGGEITSPQELNNPNLELVKAPKSNEDDKKASK